MDLGEGAWIRARMGLGMGPRGGHGFEHCGLQDWGKGGVDWSE